LKEEGMNRFPRIVVAAVLMAMVGSMAFAWNDPGGSGGGVKTERTAQELRQLLEDYRALAAQQRAAAAILTEEEEMRQLKQTYRQFRSAQARQHAAAAMQEP
jgi:molybdenum-dependent DNA-binding transcriptional regulator ModE